MPVLFTKLRNTLVFLKKNGFIAFFKEYYLHISNLVYEYRYGVDTTGFIPSNQLSKRNKDSVDYAPLPYHYILASFKLLEIPAQQCSLLDFGCGKGRVLIAALKNGFNYVQGVEMSDLSELAVKNLSNTFGSDSPPFDVQQEDACTYKIDESINMFFFFNPFIGETLELVVQNMYKSIADSPRKAWVIFFNNTYFDKAIEGENWISKYHQTRYYKDDVSLGIYRINQSFFSKL